MPLSPHVKLEHNVHGLSYKHAIEGTNVTCGCTGKYIKNLANIDQ